MPSWEDAARADAARTVIVCAGCDDLRDRLRLAESCRDDWQRLCDQAQDGWDRANAELGRCAEEVRRLRQQNLALCERVASQSELLGRRAEKGEDSR